MKVVYVYTGDKIDKYYFMIQISISSLMKHMPDSDIVIVTDFKTKRFIEETQDDILTHKDVSFVAVDLPHDMGATEASRFLKTSLRSILSGDFIFIDCDTVICEDLSSIQINKSIAMVLDNHALLSKQGDAASILKERARNRGIDIIKCEKYYNSGVMFVKDDAVAHNFFNMWHNEWKRTKKDNMYQDQFSLNAVNLKLDVIEELNGCWNCQVLSHPFVIQYIANAKIIHYFNAQNDGYYLLNDANVLKQGYNSTVVQDIVNNPRVAFKETNMYSVDSNTARLLSSRSFRLLELFSKKAKPMFNLCESVLRFVFKLLHDETKVN